mgnify:FL=1
MKITCNRRDEILKQKKEWESERDKAMEQSSEESIRFHQAEYAVTSVIENEIRNKLNTYKALQFNVNVERSFRGGLQIYIQCNENNKFDDAVALSWSYRATLNDDGQVEKETSSWSGLKATTDVQMESLTQTLQALQYLNSVDWATVLNKEMPDWRDYLKTDASKYVTDAPNFNQMLVEADIEESIGKDVLLVGAGSINQRGYPMGRAYYMILKETPSQYEIAKIPGYSLDDEDVDMKSIVEKNKKYSYRVRKDKLIELLNKPIETVEV